MTQESHTHLTRPISAFPRIAGAITLSAGTVVIIGWIFDVPLLKSLHPSLVSMKANTAIAFALAGISVLLLSSQGEGRQKTTARFLASIVFVIGLLTILEYAFTWDAGIDQLFFKEPQGTIGTYSPGRMALNTAISFCLIGITVGAMWGRSRWSKALAQIAPLVVALFGLLVLLTYVYGLSGFIGISNYTRMALHTAVTFVLLSIGLLYLQPDAGIITVVRGEGSAGYMARRLILVAFCLPVVLGWLVSHGKMRGMYDNQFGEAIGATAYIGIFVFMVWIVGRSLIKLEADRKRAEEVLSVSEVSYRRLFEAARDGILILDAETGMVVDVNPFLVEMLGYSREQFFGKRIWELGFFKDIAASKLNFTELQQKEFIQYENLPLETGKRELINVEFVSYVYSVNDKKVVQCNIRNITERMRAEEKLRVSEGQFRTMANAMPQLAWIAKADGYIFWYNQRWYEYTGTTPEQMEGWGWQSVHDPAVLPHVMQNWTGSIASGKPFEMEFPLRGADGRFHTFLTRVQPLRDDSGQIVQWFGTNTDVEQLKRAEEASARMAAIVESSDDAIIGKDLNGIITSWNAGAEKLFGYSAHELVGRSITQIVPQDRLNEEEQVLVHIRRNEGVQHFETVRLAKDGRLIDVSVTVSPIKDAAGKIVGASKVARDITERKQAEEKIRKLNAELETRVIERTAQLEVANKELDAFAYSVSHDLRAPLRSIDGFSLVLLEDYAKKLDEKGKDSLQKVRAATQRMAQLIDDILGLSRVSRSELCREGVNLSAIADEIAAELRRTDPQRDVEFVITPEVRAIGDAHLLHIVLDNLMRNALKFTSKHAKARIEFGTADRDGTRVCYVRDDGAGFDMQYADKMFGAFQRMHSSVEFPGTGIGLATVQRIINRHGGKVWAESEVEKGATFYFTLQM